ncbi:Cyclin-dependent kinase 12 [Aspergillus hancockii]|nr:Cyclin-dependent kinase 12 [Aspergillus hancockii]
MVLHSLHHHILVDKADGMGNSLLTKVVPPHTDSPQLAHRVNSIKVKASIMYRQIISRLVPVELKVTAETITRTREVVVDSLAQVLKITSSQSPPAPPTSEEQMPKGADQGDNASRPSGQDRPVDDEKPGTENGDSQNMLPTTTGQSDTSATPNKGGKISFAFKAKTTPAPAPKPVPDLAQRMLAREPPPRVTEPPRNKMASGPPPKFKPEPRFDRRERDRERERDRHRERDRDRGKNDRRDFRDSRGFRDPRDRRDARRDDHRFDHRPDRRRGDRRQDFRPERRRERSPEPKKQPKILTRPKQRPTLPEEFAKSDSVYYRKPGNESVIGAGTYGKVFKAIHVYTQGKVALKKIRMEGEKDGFPVTAVREIKLLQHLRNHNVVSLLEVMVERNECFMVFEYLSHDLTGLINHPTFTLTAAHKKDLAKQMFEGLSYLHHRGVLHRDIKAANILISNRGLLKYADFGLARFFSKSRQLDYTNRVITIWYRPPELLLGETRYGPAVDVWSAACVYVEMFTKKAVFPGEGGEISQLEKLYNCLGTPTRAEWPDIAEMPWFELMRPTERKKRVFEEVYGQILTPAALDLVSQIFRYDPLKRPTAEQILKHPYFVSEEPRPQQAIELENIEGDWHEFESKALRKEKDREARRAEYQKDKEKRKAGTSAPPSERETKRARQDAEDSQPTEH